MTFLTYAGTLQAEALTLVAAKTRASLAVEGELPEEGLAALDGDGGDVYLALARRLAGGNAGSDGNSLEALFAAARGSENEADEVLVAGGWADGSVLPQPIPFPAHAQPDHTPLDELLLFAAPSPPSDDTSSGNVFTLDELVTGARLRKRRPRPVPKGQLVLFAS